MPAVLSSFSRPPKRLSPKAALAAVFGGTLLELSAVICVTCNHGSIVGYRNAWRIRLLNMGLVAYGGSHDLRIVSARSGNAVGICTRDLCPIQIRSALVARACER